MPINLATEFFGSSDKSKLAIFYDRFTDVQKVLVTHNAFSRKVARMVWIFDLCAIATSEGGKESNHRNIVDWNSRSKMFSGGKSSIVAAVLAILASLHFMEADPQQWKVEESAVFLQSSHFLFQYLTDPTKIPEVRFQFDWPQSFYF